MVLPYSKSKQQMLLAFFLLTLASCKQSEFYDKAALLETGPNAKSEIGTSVGNAPSAAVNLPDLTSLPVIPVLVITPPIVIAAPVVTQNPGGVVDQNSGSVTDPIVSQNPGAVVDQNSGSVTDPIVSQNPGVDSTPIVSLPPADTTVTSPVALSPVILNDRVEYFTQDTSRNGDVDILWVIDDSGSMADNQDALSRNFNSFITQFLDKKIDFKMAITTTDGTSTRNGKMIGDSSKLTSASAIGNRNAFINNFMKWVKVGTSGSGIEQGLKTASSFLDRYGASYLRDDAYLAIVFLSDEEDQSGKAITNYLSQYQAAKRSKGMVKAYSIVTQNLQSTKQWETLGVRYNAVSKATGGTMSDISEDFSSTLKDIGGSIVNLVDRFALAESPYQDKISVFVNSIKMESGWSFDINSHSLKFNANAIPVEGAKIEIRYQVKASVLGAI